MITISLEIETTDFYLYPKLREEIVRTTEEMLQASFGSKIPSYRISSAYNPNWTPTVVEEPEEMCEAMHWYAENHGVGCRLLKDHDGDHDFN